MNGWYLVSVVPWVVVFLTATARVNDIKLHQRNSIWHLRIIGLSASMGVAVVMLATPVTISTWYMPSATWQGALIAWAWGLTWFTTPGLPPWAKYIAGTHRVRAPEAPKPSFTGRVTGEFRALADSARPRARDWDGNDRRESIEGDPD